MLKQFRVARVAADPPRAPGGADPAGCRALGYYRLHGSPKVYYSAYEAPFLAKLGERISADLALGREGWAIFDNTTLGAATRNALDLAMSCRRRLPKKSLAPPDEAGHSRPKRTSVTAE